MLKALCVGMLFFTAVLLYFTVVFVNGQLENLDTKDQAGRDWMELTNWQAAYLYIF